MLIITKEALGLLPVVIPPLEKQKLIGEIYRLSLREKKLVSEIQAKRSQLIETTLLESIYRD